MRLITTQPLSRYQRRLRALSIASLAAISSLLFPTFAYADTQTHTVRAGETLSQIAVEYNVELGELMSLNELYNANQLLVGQELLIPAASIGDTFAAEVEEDANQLEEESLFADDYGNGDYVIVAPGDTFSEIALRYGMSLSELLALNEIVNPNLVLAGQTLRVVDRLGNVPTSEGVASSTEVQAAYAIADEHFVQPGETIWKIALDYDVSVSGLLHANGLESPDYVNIGQRLVIPGSRLGLPLVDLSFAPTLAEQQRIVVDLSEQTLTAWQGATVMMHTLISSGERETPTVLGQYTIQTKLEKQDMGSEEAPLPNVPWVMYFWGGYAFHGAYWHNNFGMPMSHGCINMRNEEAKFLYDWAQVGAEVIVKE